MIVWKPIKGYEGRYLVSNQGDIMSCYSGKILSPRNDECGYEIVHLTNEYGKKHHLVHRLVAHAFIPKPKGINEINHINEIKNDNRVENLEWVSHKENLQKYWDNHPEKKKEVVKSPRKTNDYRNTEIVQITLSNEFVKVWKNISTIVKELGYNNSSITECCLNKRHKAYGYKWQFAIDIKDWLDNQKNKQ